MSLSKRVRFDVQALILKHEPLTMDEREVKESVIAIYDALIDMERNACAKKSVTLEEAAFLETYVTQQMRLLLHLHTMGIRLCRMHASL
jgi:hypothetical protein